MAVTQTTSEQRGGGTPQPTMVGRDREVAAVADFVAARAGNRALVVTGEAGMGKTTLWKEALAAARETGARVLATRASEAELQLPFVALADFLEDVELAAVPGVPAPQLRALEVALFRVEAEGSDLSLGVAGGLTSVLRSLAREEPLVIAVDDVPWLDRASADALTFAARRLRDAEIGFLFARRPGPATALEAAFSPPGAESLEIGPLSLGAVRHLLWERLALTLPRSVLRRVFELSGGNPLLALELGRVLIKSGAHAGAGELPLPDVVDDLFGDRVRRLAPPVRRLLLATALSGDLSLADAAGIASAGTLDDGVREGVLHVERERIRADHPLLAAAAIADASPDERRALHADLAGVARDERRRVRHLALAADRPQARLAAAAAAAAAAASARGAWHEAAELAEHALRLTPPDSPERPARLLALAECLAPLNEVERLTAVVREALPSLPPGPERARAYLLLIDGAIETNEDVRRLLESALEESGEDADLHLSILGEIATNTAVIRLEGLREMDASVDSLREQALEAGGATERTVLHAVAWVEALRGRPLEELCERFDRDCGATSSISMNPSRVAGQRWVWRGDVDRARVVLSDLLKVADERGEGYGYALQRLHMCELELRSGRFAEAERLLEEWLESGETMIWPMYERCRALLAAGRGSAPEAKDWAAKAIARAEATGVRWDLLEARRARGIAELLARNPSAAVVELGAVWEHMRREGVDDPGVFPVAPDLIEAYVELDELELAERVADQLAELAEEQEHPWGLASAERSRGLVALAHGYDEPAAARLAEAAKAYGRLGLRFDEARCLLAFGRSLRRHRKWARAREVLRGAAAAFEAMGSDGWAEQARAELERTGSRRPVPLGDLTPTEARVAALAAAGRSNKEIAAELVVSVYTVEKHLSHVYAKLGVRSRGQLRSALPA